jgi:hypothetical protein
MCAVMKNHDSHGPPKNEPKLTLKHKNMKKMFTPILLAALGAAGGCNTPVSVSGDYATPKQTIAGQLNATTNSVTVSGSYSTTNQSVGGSVTVGK